MSNDIPVQEPVVYIRKDQLQKAMQSAMLCEVTSEPRQDRVRIYTAPQKRSWVGLTDEEQMALLKDSDGKTRHWLVWQVEAKLKDKNG